MFGLVLWAKWRGISIDFAVGSLGLDDEFVRDVGKEI